MVPANILSMNFVLVNDSLSSRSQSGCFFSQSQMSEHLKNEIWLVEIKIVALWLAEPPERLFEIHVELWINTHATAHALPRLRTPRPRFLDLQTILPFVSFERWRTLTPVLNLTPLGLRKSESIFQVKLKK